MDDVIERVLLRLDHTLGIVFVVEALERVLLAFVPALCKHRDCVRVFALSLQTDAVRTLQKKKDIAFISLRLTTCI